MVSNINQNTPNGVILPHLFKELERCRPQEGICVYLPRYVLDYNKLTRGDQEEHLDCNDILDGGGIFW